MILVDHNETSQAVANIDEAEILEIIDHHRIGSLETIGPVYFRNQPLGCTATIIYQMYQEQGVELTREIAGLFAVPSFLTLCCFVLRHVQRLTAWWQRSWNDCKN